MAEPKKSTFELTVELVKAIAWPLLVAFFLIAFWSPLQKSADLIPTILGRSDSITIAGMSLKLSPSLKSKATPDIEHALSRLTNDSIEKVLGLGDTTSWDRNSIDAGRREYKQLVDTGLVVEVSAEELATLNAARARVDGYMVRTTDLGKRTRTFLRAVVAEVLQQFIATPPSTAK